MEWVGWRYVYVCVNRLCFWSSQTETERKDDEKEDEKKEKKEHVDSKTKKRTKNKGVKWEGGVT